jgi:hypothetical protein
LELELVLVSLLLARHTYSIKRSRTHGHAIPHTSNHTHIHKNTDLFFIEKTRCCNVAHELNETSLHFLNGRSQSVALSQAVVADLVLHAL